MIKEEQKRLGTINEVAQFIMRFADYSTLDTFHIPLEVMKSLINGVIPVMPCDSEAIEEKEPIG